MYEIAPSNTALTPEQAFPFQQEIDTWNMDEAVARIRPKVEQHQKLSAELARDLWIANSVLARRGGDRRSEDAQVFGFCDFLELVGVSKKKAYLLLKLYVPEEDKLLTFDEYDQRHLKNANPAIPQLDSDFERLVAHAMATGERLAGWTNEHEAEYRKRKDNEKFAELARKWSSQKIKLNWGNNDYFSQTLLKNGKMYTKVNLETKEQYKAQLEVFDMITTFLESFANPQVRLAAVCNIGLRIRQFVNDIAEEEQKLNAFTGVQE